LLHRLKNSVRLEFMDITPLAYCLKIKGTLYLSNEKGLTFTGRLFKCHPKKT